MTRIHLAQTPPAFCAACYSANPQSRHVDFGAAYEGPTFAASDPDTPVTGGMTITVDDLIVCENCLRQAAAVIGLADPGELADRLQQAEAVVDRLSDALAKQAEYSATLEDSLTARPAPSGHQDRQAGPPPSNRKRPATRAKG